MSSAPIGTRAGPGTKDATRIRRPIASAGVLRPGRPLPTARNERCPGAMAQLADVHRTLCKGPALQLRAKGEVEPRRALAEPRPGQLADRQAAPSAAPTPAVIQRELSGEEFVQIEELAGYIQAKYPPKEYHYIGLGKSPTPVIAFLQAYGEVKDPDVIATNLPLSKFSAPKSNMTEDEKMLAKEKKGKKLSRDQRGRLKDHFDRFVPTADDLAGKKILLIDFIQSGMSLVAGRRHLEAYLQKKYRGGLGGWWRKTFGEEKAVPQVVGLPLVSGAQQSDKAMKDKWQKLGLTEGLTVPSRENEQLSLSDLLGAGAYDERAEYPGNFIITDEHEPKTGDLRPDPQKKYLALKTDIKRFLAEDRPVAGMIAGADAIKEVGKAVERYDSALGEI